MNITQVTVHVDNMDAAIDFYENKLGFEVATKAHAPQVVVLKFAHFPIVLHQVNKRQAVDYANSNHIVLAFGTDDIDTTHSDLKAKGVDCIHDAPQPFPAGRMFAFRDPAGNVLECIQHQFG